MSIRATLVTALAALVSLAGSPLHAGDELPNAFAGFVPSGQYVLVLGGRVLPSARIYRSPSEAAYLLLDEAIEGGVVVLPRRRCVDEVRTNEIVRNADGSIDLRKASIDCSFGPFELQRTDIVFNVRGQEARLTPKPALTGRHAAAGLLDHTPEYARAADAYTPDAQMVATLKAAPREIQVVVFFGSWCSFCTRFMPHTLRVEREIQGSKFRFAYHGLQPPPAAWITEDAVKYGVKKLLTGIVYADGREVGRIVGNEWTQPEKALLKFAR